MTPRMAPPSLSLAELEERLRFKPLWEVGIRGGGMTVAVLDTGRNLDETVDSVVIDDRDFTGEDNPAGAAYWHGTMVARGILLIAPEAHIANFKVIPERGALTRETVCQAVQFCIQEFPRYPIINLSLSFQPDSCSATTPCTLCATVNEAAQRGIVVVAAAGNLGPAPDTITCPARAVEAIPVVSLWTKRETDWWESRWRLARWWWKDFTGEFGKAYGTSFSGAWASGGVALLKSGFPESQSHEIREAILASAYRPPNAPETSGLFQCQEAFDGMLSPVRYQSALAALHFNAGNKDAQRNGSYFAHELGLILSVIKYKMLPAGMYAQAAQELTAVRRSLVPNALPDYEKQVDQLLQTCRAQSTHVS